MRVQPFLVAPPRTLASLGRRALLVAAASLALPAWPTQLPPQNLSQMIAKADLIVSGQVTAVKDGIENGLPFTEITLKVGASAKQNLEPNSSYSFRQYGLLKPRKLSDGRYLLPAKIEGMPTWQVGERVLTFMNKPAPNSGLRTPVGLAQGKFSINGGKAANAFNNEGLFEGVTVNSGLLRSSEAAMLNKRAGAVDLAVFQGLVNRAVNNNWVDTGAMR